MVSVRIDDPAEMNILGLFLAERLRAHGGKCRLRGALAVDADGMRATINFEADGVTVTRKDIPARCTISAPLPLLIEAMLRPRLRTVLRVKVSGSRFFALSAMRVLRP